MAGYNSYTPQYQGTNSILSNYSYQYPQFSQPLQQPQFQPQMQVPTQTQSQEQLQQDDGGITWVQGEAGAKSAFVKPGKSKLLVDSEDDVFYIKSVDISGMPLPLRVFDYKERINVEPFGSAVVQEPIQNPEYVTREEFEKRISEIVTKKTSGTKTASSKKGGK